MKIRLVVFDVDGVLTEVRSSWAFVHEALGVADRAKKYAEMFERGEIDYEKWMELDTSLWVEATGGKITRWDLERILSGIPIRRDASDVSRCIHRMGKRVALLSGGIDLLVARVAAVVGAEAWMANVLRFDKEWRLVPGGLPVVGVTKVKALRYLLGQLEVSPEATMYVGDSAWDADAMRIVGYPVAFGDDRALNSIAKYKVRSLSEICELLQIIERQKDA